MDIDIRFARFDDMSKVRENYNDHYDIFSSISPLLKALEIISIGTGKTIVLLFSAAMLPSV